MGRSCGTTCAKVFLIIFNFLFLISGCTSLGTGIWMHFDKGSEAYERVVKETATGPVYENNPYFLIGFGTLVTVLSFLGCCGACAESVCFLCLYTLLLFLVLGAELLSVILIAVYKNKLLSDLGDAMERQVHHDYSVNLPGLNKTNPISLSWNYIQVQLECCGARGPEDYMNSYWYNITKEKESGTHVPATCCILSNQGHATSYKYPQPLSTDRCQSQAIIVPKSSAEREAMDAIHVNGCHEAVVDFMGQHIIGPVIGCLVGLFVLEILHIVAACVLMSRIRREQSKYPCAPRKEKGSRKERGPMLQKARRV